MVSGPTARVGDSKSLAVDVALDTHWMRVVAYMRSVLSVRVLYCVRVGRWSRSGTFVPCFPSPGDLCGIKKKSLPRVNLAASDAVSVLLFPTGHPFPSAYQGPVRFLPSLGLDGAYAPGRLTLSWVCGCAGAGAGECVLSLFWGLLSFFFFFFLESINVRLGKEPHVALLIWYIHDDCPYYEMESN